MIFVPAVSIQHLRAPRGWSTGSLAGLAGGSAEVAWIVLYERLSGGDAAGVAHGVTDSLFPTLAAAPLAVPLGVAIHMVLAILFGIAIAAVLRSMLPSVSGTALEPVVVTGMLVGVWAVNFFVVLPALNPAFVSLVPYGASLISKVLFGIATAFVLQLLNRPLRHRRA